LIALLRALALGGLLCAVALAGCTDDKGTDLVKGSDGYYRVALSLDNKFSPAHGHVPVGAIVEWVDNGGMHDVTDADHDPPQWSSDDTGANHTKLSMGDSFLHTFSAAGTYHVKCKMHADMGMTQTITVG